MVVLRVVRVGFWRGVASGMSVEGASAVVGVSPTWGKVEFRQRGGVIPDVVQESGRFLSFRERALIEAGLVQRMSLRAIARMVGRSVSTVSREVRRNRPRDRLARRYQARRAQLWADRRRVRPKPGKLAVHPELRRVVMEGLDRRWSPEQISARLVERFPDREDMRVSHETIYRSLYVQARGGLRREVEVALRSGRTIRAPRRRAAGDRRGKSRIAGMVMISDRPAEVDDRAVPGHWEGDLIIGKDNRSQIGTLVERATRYVLLVHLPGPRDPATVADALVATMRTLPRHLARSLTWDQGTEMGQHHRITLEADVPVYFCDPRSPWQRGSNENTNGLLRQYFPKGTDLSQHSAEHLAFVAAELNGRPRKTLGWATPAEAFQKLLSDPQQPGVATTP